LSHSTLQWNGDPEGQGLIIFNFLLKSGNIERLKNGLQHIECARCETTRFWPSLSRDTGAEILEIIAQATAQKHVPVVLELSFANDGRCEWAYVVDL